MIETAMNSIETTQSDTTDNVQDHVIKPEIVQKLVTFFNFTIGISAKKHNFPIRRGKFFSSIVNNINLFS